jgi:hypothetical protein
MGFFSHNPPLGYILTYKMPKINARFGHKKGGPMGRTLCCAVHFSKAQHVGYFIFL